MNQKETICPLLTTNTVIGENGQVSICVEEQCAWWIEDKQKCAIKALGGKK